MTIISYVYCPEVFAGSIHGALFYDSRIRNLPDTPIFQYTQTITEREEPINFYGETNLDRERIKKLVIDHMNERGIPNTNLMNFTRFQNWWYLWCYFAVPTKSPLISVNDMIVTLRTDYQTSAYQIAAAVAVYGLQTLFAPQEENPSESPLRKEFVRSFNHQLRNQPPEWADNPEMALRGIDTLRTIYGSPAITLYKGSNPTPIGNGPFFLWEMEPNYFTILLEPPIQRANRPTCDDPSRSEIVRLDSYKPTRNKFPAKEQPYRLIDTDFFQADDISRAEIEVARFYKKNQASFPQEVPICALMSSISRSTHNIISSLNKDIPLNPREIRSFKQQLERLNNLLRNNITPEETYRSAFVMMGLLNSLEYRLNRYDTGKSEDSSADLGR